MNILLKIILLTFLSICGGALYRLGGSGETDRIAEFGWLPKWIREFPKKRDVGVNLLIIASAILMGVKAPFYAWLVTFGLMWASLSSYWDWMFGGKDNFYMHGFMVGFSFLPLVIWGNIILTPFLIRSILLGLFVGGWSYLVDKYGMSKVGFRSDIWSEWGRGIIMVISNIFKIWR